MCCASSTAGDEMTLMISVRSEQPSGFTQIQLLPVGGTVDLGVNLRLLLLHHPPGSRGDKELFVDTVSEAVRDTACDGEARLNTGELRNQNTGMPETKKDVCRTGDGSAYFCGGGFSHLQ